MPLVTTDKTAGSQYACLLEQCGVNLGNSDQGKSIVCPKAAAHLRGLIFTADGAGNNQKFWRWIASQYSDSPLGSDGEPEDPLILTHTCLHHALSLVQAPVCAKVLDVSTPCFCIAKQFGHGKSYEKISDAVYAWLEHFLDWKRQEDFPDFVPDAQDVEYARDVVELMYLRRANRKRKSRSSKSRVPRHKDRKQEYAERLVDASPGNWRSRIPLYWCRGCCKTRSDAVNLMYFLIMFVFFGTTISEPADNKWVSVLPVVQDVGAMLCFYNMYGYVENVVNAKASGGQKKVESVLPADLVHIDFDKQRSTYNRRAARFVQGTYAQAKCMLSVILLTLIAELHFHLFKHCSQRAARGVDETIHVEPHPIFDYVDPGRSPAVKVFRALSALFLVTIDESSSTWSTWRPFVRLAGFPQDWPDDLHFMIRASLLLLLGGVWQHFIKRWQRWPWKFCSMFDPRLSLAARHTAMDEFCAMSRCCLDPACSRKMHWRFRSREALENLQEFMLAFLNSVPLTTAVIECFFGEMRLWLSRSTKPYSSATLNAKAVCSTFEILARSRSSRKRC